MYEAPQRSESQPPEWRPPPWVPFVLALVFAALLVIAFFSGSGWRTLAVLGTLFALCLKVAYSGYRAYPDRSG